MQKEILKRKLNDLHTANVQLTKELRKTVILIMMTREALINHKEDIQVLEGSQAEKDLAQLMTHYNECVEYYTESPESEESADGNSNK